MNRKIILLLLVFLFSRPQNLKALTLEEGIADPPLKKAWEFVLADRPTDALTVLSNYRPNPEARVYYHFILGKSLEKNQKLSEAMEHYRTAYLYAPPGELKEVALLERAAAYRRIKNYDEAKLTYNLFLSHYPKSKYWEKGCLGMAHSLAAIGLLPKALYYYERAGDSLEVLYAKAVTLHRLGQWQKAHELFSRGLTRDKIYLVNSEELTYYYGENLHQIGKDQEAIPYLSTTLKDPILKMKANIALGKIALKSGKKEEAVNYFNSALSSTDRKVKQEALFQLAEAQLGAGKKTEARQIFQEYLQKYPTGKAQEVVHLKLATLDMEEGRFEQAGKRFKAVVLVAHPTQEALIGMERCLLQMKEKDPAQMVSVWKAVSRKFLEPSREPFLLLMSEALKGSGKPYLELHRWLIKNGSLKAKVRSLLALAETQVEMGDLNSAWDTLTALKKGKVTGDDLLRLEARILHSRKDYGEAAERLLSIKKVGLQDLPLLEDCLSSARNGMKALAFFEKQVVLLGGNANNYITLADSYYQKGKKKEALQYYQKALEKDSLNEWALLRAGSLLTGEDARKMLGRINDGSLVGKLARINQREKEIEGKMGGGN